MIEVRFIQQSKCTTVQVHQSGEVNEEDSNKVLQEAKRVYAKGLAYAKTFTMSQH